LILLSPYHTDNRSPTQEKKSNGEVIGALETACAEVKTQLDIEKGSKSSAEVELQKQVADLIGNMEDMTAELERSRAAQAGEAKEAERLRELVKAMEVQVRSNDTMQVCLSSWVTKAKQIQANEQQHDLRASLESEFQQRSMMAVSFGKSKSIVMDPTHLGLTCAGKG
jgi:hypothetical protein